MAISGFLDDDEQTQLDMMIPDSMSDEKVATMQHREFLMNQGMCPNECGALTQVNPTTRVCQECGFTWHGSFYRQEAAS